MPLRATLTWMADRRVRNSNLRAYLLEGKGHAAMLLGDSVTQWPQAPSGDPIRLASEEGRRASQLGDPDTACPRLTEQDPQGVPGDSSPHRRRARPCPGAPHALWGRSEPHGRGYPGTE